MRRCVLFGALVLATLPSFAGSSAWSPGGYLRERVRPLPRNGPAVRVLATENDPVGDTIGVGPVQHDVTSVSANVINGSLVIVVQFAGTISPPDSGEPDAVFGLIDLDIDTDPSTGCCGATEVFCDGFNLGVERTVDLFFYDSDTGQAPIVGGSGPAFATFAPMSMTVTIPLGNIGDDGIVDLALVVGTVPEPTDCAPGTAALRSTHAPPIPSLGVWGLAALFASLLGVALIRLRT
jgi:hypothetical protein